MKNTIKRIPARIKNHVKHNKMAYAMGTVATLAIVLQQANVKSFNRFLTEKGIDPMEYYCPEYYEELKTK